MVVTAIISVIGVGSIVAITRFSERREAQTDALALAEHLRKIQVKASAVDVPTGCTGITNYTVSMSGASLTVNISCTVGSVTDAADLRFSLQNSVFSSAKTIVFDSRTVAATITDIDICGNTYKYRVSVSALGNISQPIYQPSGC
ncbi:hypothetical protein HYS10_00110 [Candidatus Collierbacteria bacterium]|nr:hypothetical protein [Candidatus Collierbacteria bacterium]